MPAVVTSTSEWDNDYARVARVASQLRTSGLSHSLVGADPRQLQQHVARLDAALSTLSLPPNEMQRRRRLVQHLGGQQQQQQQQQQPKIRESFGGGTVHYRPSGPPSEVGGGSSSSDLGMARLAQDEIIDELEVGVSRLREQTQTISDEARMHVRLLDEMGTNLETAHAGLDAETKRAAKIKADQSVWRLQWIIAGEAILFVLLLLMGLT